MLIKSLATYALSLSMVLSGCGAKTAENTENIYDSVSADGALQVHFIDVGQADCELIKFPDGQFALIDAGDSSHKDEVVNYLTAQGVEDIAFAVATHGHEDHIGGMQSVIENFNVKKVIRPYQDHDSTLYTNMLYAIEESGAEEIIAKYGDTFETGGAEFEIFAPVQQEYSDFNDCSVVLKMTYGNRSFLFTGDAGKASEEDMLSMGYNLKSDVLKVGHHGSRTANTEEFIKAVSPYIAVISVGKDNKYDLPDEEPIERLESVGSKVYRTDEVGTVIVITDGEKAEVSYGGGAEEIKAVSDNTGSANKTEAQKTEAVIGNSNTKVYHSLSCGSLPSEKNRVMFSSAQEAENAGYRPHSSCTEK